MKDASEPAETIRIAAAVMRDERGRMLLVRKRGTQAFIQPGGKINPDETPESALIREPTSLGGVTLAPLTRDQILPRYFGRQG